MNQILLAAAIFLTGIFAQATTTTTCFKREHRYAKITSIIQVDRDADTNARILLSDLLMNETSINYAENNCNSRRCIHSGVDTTYVVYPHFRRGTDEVIGVTVSARSPVIVYEEHLSRCINEDEAG